MIENPIQADLRTLKTIDADIETVLVTAPSSDQDDIQASAEEGRSHLRLHLSVG